MSVTNEAWVCSWRVAPCRAARAQQASGLLAAVDVELPLAEHTASLRRLTAVLYSIAATLFANGFTVERAFAAIQKSTPALLDGQTTDVLGSL